MDVGKDGLIGGQYAIEREVGRGGSATVYLARVQRDGSRVALKLLHEEFSGSRAAERFSQEIRLLREFAHPNILTVLDSGEWNGRPFYVMRYVEGESLQERLRRERRLPFDEVVRIGRRLCDALGYAHERRVVHRDVKPANVMLAGDEVYLTDFGIAKALAPVAGQLHSTTGVARGTRAYMSPEQAMADRDLDHRSDIFSLGCVLYEMMAGQNPFHSADEARMLMRRVTDAPDPLSRHRDGVPAGLEGVVMKALAREPADRWGSVGEMGEGLGLAAADALRRPRWGRRAGAVILLTLLAWPVGRMLSVGGNHRAFSHAAIDWVDARIAVTAVEPFGADSAVRSGTRLAAAALHAALASQRGIPLAPLLPSDEQSAHSREDAVRLARARDVRLLVTLALRIEGDRMHVNLALIDAVADSTIRADQVSFLGRDIGSDDVARSLREVALRRLTDTTLPDDPGSTRDYRALRALQAAIRYIDGWQVDSARTALLAAVEIDPGLARGHMLLAELSIWSAQSGASLHEHAVRAFGATSPSDSVVRLFVGALEAMAADDYARACNGFERAAALQPQSFEAWFSLGECRRRDPVVVRDGASRTGWRFRSDLGSAERAFRRALPLARGRLVDLTYERLLSTIYAESGVARAGVSETPDAERFVAFPSLRLGEVVFEPQPLRAAAKGPLGSVPGSLFAALEHERRRRRDVTRAWTQAAPMNPVAIASLALAIEATGEVFGASGGESEVVTLLRRSNALTADSLLHVRNANAVVRLELKQGHYDHAARLADSLLRAVPRPVGEQAALLAPLAVLLDRSREAHRLLTSSYLGVLHDESWPNALPDPLLRNLLAELVVRAAIGECGVELRALWGKVGPTTMAIADSLSARRQATELLERARRLYFPCDRGESPPATPTGQAPLVLMLAAAVRADTATVTRAYAGILQGRQGASAAEVSWDAIFLEAWALAQVGRTEDAAAHIDRGFTALPRAATHLTTDVSAVAGFIRALLLRKTLSGVTDPLAVSESAARAARELGWKPSAGQRITEAR